MFPAAGPVLQTGTKAGFADPAEWFWGLVVTGFLRLPLVCYPQALLHQYFFTAPLPAHPSELPIPQRPGGPAPKAHPGPPHVHDFHVDRPLEESLLNPELIRPFIPEG